MTGWPHQVSRARPGRELLLWISAATVVLSVHAGAAAYVLADPGEPPGDVSPAPALMIELAPEPVAEKTDLNQITEDREDAADRPAETASLPDPVEPVQPPPAPAPEPEPPQPVVEQAEPAAKPPDPAPAEEEVSEPQPDPLEEQMLAALDNVEVPLPIARPVPEKPRPKPAEKTEKQAPKPRPAPKPASRAATKAAAEVKQSNRDAAPARTAGSGASSAVASTWKSRVAAHLERRKRFPSAARARGEQGTVLVVFRIDDGGRVISTALARSSGFAALDQAALDMVRRASPVPAPPEGVAKTVTAPVRFVRK